MSLRKAYSPQFWIGLVVLGFIAVLLSTFSIAGLKIRAQAQQRADVIEALRYRGYALGIQQREGRIESLVANQQLRQDVRSIHADLSTFPDSLKPKLHVFEDLEELSICRAGWSGDDLVHLQGLNNLRVLNISYGSFSDDDLKHLRELPNLEVFFFYNTDVQGPGLSHLLNLPSLTEVVLDWSEHSRSNLKQLPQLKYIELQQRDVVISENDMRWLLEHFPDWEIRLRIGGWLGPVSEALANHITASTYSVEEFSDPFAVQSEEPRGTN